MAFALFAFTAIFILLASAGLLVFYREAMFQRLSHAISPQEAEEMVPSAEQGPSRPVSKSNHPVLRQAVAKEPEGNLCHAGAVDPGRTAERIQRPASSMAPKWLFRSCLLVIGAYDRSNSLFLALFRLPLGSRNGVLGA